jgi:hypothetical protein
VPAKFDCGCLTEAGWHEHDYTYIIMPDGTKYHKDSVINTGGRNAEWIYLEDGEVAVLYSSNGNPMEIYPIHAHISYSEIEENYEPIASYEASVHGCWKLQLHQSLIIYKKKEV